jgi:predicted RNA binding protein YcfA (HicA-like mRNA interferase family)
LNNFLLRSDLSVKRRDLIKYLEKNGFYLLREGGNHSIYTNGTKTLPIKRHRTFDRITANELCKQAGLKAKF